MAIQITKLEKIIKDNDSILTPLYGKVKVVSNIDSNDYTYFDTVNKYDLFVSNDIDDVVAIKNESKENIREDIDSVIDDFNNDDEIEFINKNFDVDKVNWAEKDNAIIIKASNETIKEIINYYEENDNYVISYITPEILFLEPISKIYEDGSDEVDKILDKADDNSLKDLATKAGVDPQKLKNRDELKGVVKGAISSPDKPFGTI